MREITKEELDRMKKDIESNPDSDAEDTHEKLVAIIDYLTDRELLTMYRIMRVLACDMIERRCEK